MALQDIYCKRLFLTEDRIKVFVAGAGRGPLVDEVLKSVKELNTFGLNIQIWAIEKNPNAMLSLKYCNETK